MKTRNFDYYDNNGPVFSFQYSLEGNWYCPTDDNGTLRTYKTPEERDVAKKEYTKAPLKVSVVLTDVKLNAILQDIEQFINDVDSYEYGLPSSCNAWAQMRAIIRKHLTN